MGIGGHGDDQGIGEGLPAPTGMAGGLRGFDREDRVEQEHTAFGPGLQTAVGRRGQAEVARELLADVAQAGRNPDTGCHGKRQSLGLTWSVVGVLAQDHHPHLGQRRQRQGPQRLRRVDDGTVVQPLLQEGLQRLPGGRRPEIADQCRPVGLHRPLRGVGRLQLRHHRFLSSSGSIPIQRTLHR